MEKIWKQKPPKVLNLSKSYLATNWYDMYIVHGTCCYHGNLILTGMFSKFEIFLFFFNEHINFLNVYILKLLLSHFWWFSDVMEKSRNHDVISTGGGYGIRPSRSDKTKDKSPGEKVPVDGEIAPPRRFSSPKLLSNMTYPYYAMLARLYSWSTCK